MPFILKWIVFFVCFVKIKADCQPPDVPYGGYYSPVQDNYLPGDTVSYSCKEGFMKIGVDDISCHISGRWSGEIPFCDPPVKTRNPWIYTQTQDYSPDVLKLVDGKTDTCYTSNTKIMLELFFEEKTHVGRTRVFMQKGYFDIRAFVVDGGIRYWCGFFKNYMDSDQWIDINCEKEGFEAKSMHYHIKSEIDNPLNICEIESFSKDDVQLSLKDPTSVISKTFTNENASNLVDGNTDTCITLDSSFRRDLDVNFHGGTKVVYGARVFLTKGDVEFKLFTQDGDAHHCADIKEYLTEDQWVVRTCDPEKEASKLYVTDETGRPFNLTVCEIEAYLKSGCQKPPDVFISHGHLVVSRDKATVHCNHGYKEGRNKRLFCLNDAWEGADLECNKIFCDLPTGNSSGGEWHQQDEIPSIGSTRILQCHEPDFIMIGEPAIVKCEENGTWTFTTAKCVSKKVEESVLKIVGISVGAVCIVMLFSCIGTSLYFILKPKKREIEVEFLNTPYYETNFNANTRYKEMPRYEPPKYYEIPDTYFNEKPESDYYEIPIK